MSEVKYYFGIDFGTTNTATVVIQEIDENKKIIKLGDEFGGPFPSFVAIDRITGKSYTGRKAWIERNELSESAEIFKSLKSNLGETKRRIIAGKEWIEEEIIATFFYSLKENAKEYTNREIDSAVISIPIGFSSKKRQALRNAARIGGIEIKAFISEPSAAFFHNYKSLKRFSKVAIFDWGGGTLDISLIEVNDKKIHELAIKGMSFGGDDIDYKLAKWFHTKICNKQNKDVSFESVSLTDKDRLLFECENAKLNLSNEDITSISLRSYMDLSMIIESITYDEFEELIKIDVMKAILLLEECVESANMSMKELDAIVLIGGSSNLRVLQEMVLKRWSDIHIEVPEEPGWSTAIGAAYLGMYPGALKLNQDIGLILSDNSFYPLFEKEQELPATMKTLTFGTVDDSQDALFLFSDNTYATDSFDLNITAIKSLQVYGFQNEKIELKTEIDDELTFKTIIKSNHKPLENIEELEISDLRFYYELPSILEEL